MQKEEVDSIVRILLIQHFDIPSDAFSWKKTLEELHTNFKILSYLLFLEQLLQKQFGTKFQIIEHISAASHMPEDVMVLVMRELSD
ncbi:MAG: hypothetical protein R3B93_07615 [Bacteroidia bacterium]